MADRGRDLKISILSDADKFDLAAPAQDLEDLGRAAKDTGRELDDLDSARPARELGDLGDAAKDASRELEDLGRANPKLDKAGDEAKAAAKDLDKLGRAGDDLARDAKATAERVDNAFEKIAASSRAAAKDVDQSMDKAAKGLDEFKDESAGTARESAASFTGSFDDAAGAIQEVMANAFAGFGPIGMAGGIAAAAGIGFLVTSITEAREKVKELAAGLLDLKLDPTMDTAPGRIQQVLDTLKDSGDLARFREEAETAGIAWSDYVKALSGDADAIARVKEKLAANQDDWAGLEQLTAAGFASNDLANRLADQANATDQANSSAQALTDSGLAPMVAEQEAATKAAEDHAEAVSSLGDTIDGFTDPASVYTELLADKNDAERKTAEATARATKDQKDSWEDYVKSADVSVGEYLGTLEKQVKAQEDWASNLSTLAKRGVEDGVLEQLARMGPEGAPLIAKLTKASDAELARLVALYDRQGKAAGDKVAEGIIDATPVVVGGARDLHGQVRGALSPPINVPVGIAAPSYGEIARIRSNITAGLSGITVGVNAIAQSIFAPGRVTP